MVVYDYIAGRHVTIDSLFPNPQPTRTIETPNLCSIICNSLLVAGVSKFVTVVCESKGAIFAPAPFIAAMVITNLVVDFFIANIADPKPTFENLVKKTIAQIVVGTPLAVLTHSALALAVGTPLAIGSVALAAAMSIVASLVAGIALTIILLLSVGVIATIAS